MVKKYGYMSQTVSTPDGLNMGMSINDLVALIALQTTYTGNQIKKILLHAINTMLEEGAEEEAE